MHWLQGRIATTRATTKNCKDWRPNTMSMTGLEDTKRQLSCPSRNKCYSSSKWPCRLVKYINILTDWTCKYAFVLESLLWISVTSALFVVYKFVRPICVVVQHWFPLSTSPNRNDILSNHVWSRRPSVQCHNYVIAPPRVDTARGMHL